MSHEYTPCTELIRRICRADQLIRPGVTEYTGLTHPRPPARSPGITVSAQFGYWPYWAGFRYPAGGGPAVHGTRVLTYRGRQGSQFDDKT